MGSFVDELNTICNGKCEECETKACYENAVNETNTDDKRRNLNHDLNNETK